MDDFRFKDTAMNYTSEKTAKFVVAKLGISK